jgi:hypothetical protein
MYLKNQKDLMKDLEKLRFETRRSNTTSEAYFFIESRGDRWDAIGKSIFKDLTLEFLFKKQNKIFKEY